MSKRQHKTYSKEFKLEAIRLADESDKPVTQVARELGLRVNQIIVATIGGVIQPGMDLI